MVTSPEKSFKVAGVELAPFGHKPTLLTTRSHRPSTVFGECFVELACHLQELDGLNQHFQATVHLPLTGAVD